jgi:putative flippase GtrA
MSELEKQQSNNLKHAQSQLVKYLIVGASSAIFELLLFTFTRRIVDLNLTSSNVIAVTTATIFNFLVNRGWSFKASSKLTRSLILYLVLFSINIVFSTNAIAVMVKLGVIDIGAKLITMVMITAWNFVLYRLVVFK